MKQVFALAWCAFPLWAHVMSMSTGDITIAGDRARYELRMPLYEIAHVKTPELSLFESIRFSSGSQPARMISKTCREEPAQGAYLCSAEYAFASPVGRLDVECTFHSVTVPNHVHLLRAVKDGKRDQAIFDLSFSKAEIRFDPPTPLETAVRQSVAGLIRALGGLAHILFLATLVLAARNYRELAALVAMFLTGQLASALIAPLTHWQPAPRFVEAATALTIAYLAVEILALPQAGQRWLVAGVLGAFHGLYFALFLRSSEFSPLYVLAGAALGELTVIALFALAFARLSRVAPPLRIVQVAACLLLGTGMVWFFLRLRG